VEITTAKVVVTKMPADGTVVLSIIMTREKPTAPRRPPYAMMNCS
jgi:hypothetical protein